MAFRGGFGFSAVKKLQNISCNFFFSAPRPNPPGASPHDLMMGDQICNSGWKDIKHPFSYSSFFLKKIFLYLFFLAFLFEFTRFCFNAFVEENFSCK